jgi:ribosome-associated toxin RatA of RatAB toxin-antitoxin module
VATQVSGPDGGIAVAERVKDSIDIKGTAEAIFEVAADYASYPEWQDQVKKVDVLETDEDGYGTVVYYEVDAVLKKLSYTLDYDYSGWPKFFTWTLRDGDLKSLDGKYSFDEFDDVTEVTYEIAIEPGFKIPSVLRRQGERQIVSTALKGLKKRVESR